MNALTKYAQDDRAAWDSNLKETVYAYNTAVQDSSKHTPFEAMFGCDQWFHIQCVGLKAPPALEEQWICNDCA